MVGCVPDGPASTRSTRLVVGSGGGVIDGRAFFAAFVALDTESVVSALPMVHWRAADLGGIGGGGGRGVSLWSFIVYLIKVAAASLTTADSLLLVSWSIDSSKVGGGLGTSVGLGCSAVGFSKEEHTEPAYSEARIFSTSAEERRCSVPSEAM